MAATANHHSCGDLQLVVAESHPKREAESSLSALSESGAFQAAL